jgi:hypothetical protein
MIGYAYNINMNETPKFKPEKSLNDLKKDYEAHLKVPYPLGTGKDEKKIREEITELLALTPEDARAKVTLNEAGADLPLKYFQK